MRRDKGRTGVAGTASGTAEGTSESGSVLLDVQDLTVVYGTRRGPLPAVREVSFNVRRGEIVGLVGESGSGKSTVLSALMRMLPAGSVCRAERMAFAGQDLDRLSGAAMRSLRGRRIGLVPQRPMTSLSPTTPVRKQLALLTGGRVDAGRMNDLLASVGLGGLFDRLGDYPFQFSGGQLQRMLIAVAVLANEPDLVLADEPTTTLDPTVQAQILSLMLELRDRMHNSIVFVSHDLGVISQVCDRVGVMYGGRLVELAPMDRLFTHPRHPYTRALLRAMPGRHRRGERLQGIEGTVTGSQLIPGCPFAPRCPRADDRCRAEMPRPVFEAGAMVRCFHPEGAP